MFGHGFEAFVGENRRALPAIFETTEQAENGARIGLFALRGNLCQDFLHRPELLGFIVNDEISLVAKLFDVLAQDADTERVEGAEGGARVGGRVSSVGAGALDFGPWTLDSSCIAPLSSTSSA